MLVLLSLHSDFPINGYVALLLDHKALKGNSYQKAEYSIKYTPFETIEELELIDLVWSVTG